MVQLFHHHLLPPPLPPPPSKSRIHSLNSTVPDFQGDFVSPSIGNPTIQIKFIAIELYSGTSPSSLTPLPAQPPPPSKDTMHTLNSSIPDFQGDLVSPSITRAITRGPSATVLHGSNSEFTSSPMLLTLQTTSTSSNSNIDTSDTSIELSESNLSSPQVSFDQLITNLSDWHDANSLESNTQHTDTASSISQDLSADSLLNYNDEADEFFRRTDVFDLSANPTWNDSEETYSFEESLTPEQMRHQEAAFLATLPDSPRYSKDPLPGELSVPNSMAIDLELLTESRPKDSPPGYTELDSNISHLIMRTQFAQTGGHA